MALNGKCPTVQVYTRLHLTMHQTIGIMDYYRTTIRLMGYRANRLMD